MQPQFPAVADGLSGTQLPERLPCTEWLPRPRAERLPGPPGAEQLPSADRLPPCMMPPVWAPVAPPPPPNKRTKTANYDNENVNMLNQMGTEKICVLGGRCS